MSEKERMRKIMSKGAKTAVTVITIIVLLVLAGAVLLSGVYTISESEQGVVLTFGKPTGKAAPGLHFKVPLSRRSIRLIQR